jgi:hypothetical protein
VTRDAPAKIHLHDRVLLRDLRVGVAGDLAGLDLLPPTSCRHVDVGAAQGVRAEAGEVAASGIRRPL